MHHSITKALYEMFPREEKGDFFHAYLYLKHLNHFMYHALKASGSKPKEPESDLGDDVDDLLEAMVQSIGENAASRDTSTYHAKVVQLKDALQLLSQKKDITLEPPETVIPYQQARRVILQNPESISVGECACRAAAEESCLGEGERDVCLSSAIPTPPSCASSIPSSARSPRMMRWRSSRTRTPRASSTAPTSRRTSAGGSWRSAIAVAAAARG